MCAFAVHFIFQRRRQQFFFIVLILFFSSFWFSIYFFLLFFVGNSCEQAEGARQRERKSKQQSNEFCFLIWFHNNKPVMKMGFFLLVVETNEYYYGFAGCCALVPLRMKIPIEKFSDAGMVASECRHRMPNTNTISWNICNSHWFSMKSQTFFPNPPINSHTHTWVARTTLRRKKVLFLLDFFARKPNLVLLFGLLRRRCNQKVFFLFPKTV